MSSVFALPVARAHIDAGGASHALATAVLEKHLLFDCDVVAAVAASSPAAATDNIAVGDVSETDTPPLSMAALRRATGFNFFAILVSRAADDAEADAADTDADVGARRVIDLWTAARSQLAPLERALLAGESTQLSTAAAISQIEGKSVHATLLALCLRMHGMIVDNAAAFLLRDVDYADVAAAAAAGAFNNDDTINVVAADDAADVAAAAAATSTAAADANVDAKDNAPSILAQRTASTAALRWLERGVAGACVRVNIFCVYICVSIDVQKLTLLLSSSTQHCLAALKAPGVAAAFASGTIHEEEINLVQ
jgi:hypothetical protein